MRNLFEVWRRRSGPQPEAVQALHTHAGLIITTAARILGNMADAEDVAQDIAEKMLRSPPARVGSWAALLKASAANAAIDRIRSRRTEAGHEPPEPAEGPEQVLSDAQRAAALRQAVARLSDRDALLFSLFHFGDLSHKAIAEQMNMSPNAVGVALHRLRQRLADDLRLRLGLNLPGDKQ
ncbi:MAG: sigma-70 family RNA polymerase sigma factor [Xanthomonadales bacterium]|nr:sigma-70 family RNA polymerase sigma factor [Xanthomonadales bacterium]